MGRERRIKGAPGDAMVINQAFGQGRKALKAGEAVTVVAYGTAAYGRTQNHGRSPGIYDNPSWMAVRGATGGEAFVNDAYLDRADGGPDRLVDGDALRISDLPDTPFWETDTVADASGETMEVVHVDYLDIDGRSYLCASPDGGTRHLDAGELTLVAPGPVRRRAAGEALDFPDLAAEAAFHHLVGEADEVRNDAAGTYAFDRDEAIAALSEGLAHGLYSGSAESLATEGAKVHLATYRDPDLGERVRLDLLERLGAAPSAPAP
jgi:hypothetical protein